MNQKFLTYTVVLVLLVAIIYVDGKKEEKKGRGKGMKRWGNFCPIRSCLTVTSTNETKSDSKEHMKNSYWIQCMKEMNISMNKSHERHEHGEKKDGEHKNGKHLDKKDMNHCVAVCMAKKMGIMSATSQLNSTAFEGMVKDRMKPEYQEKFKNATYTCLESKKLSITTSITMSEKCPEVLPYMKCACESAKEVCSKGESTTGSPQSDDKDDDDSDD